MLSWGRYTRPDGLVSAMVGPTTAPELALAFDRQAPWVLLTDHGPGLGPGWHQVRVPLLASQALDPPVATVRRLGFEVLLSTTEFLRLAPELGDWELRARQFTKRPDADFPPDNVPADRYRAFGLILGVQLPHAHEAAQIIAPDDDQLTRALTRLDHPSQP